jgi:hypothetical protein
MEAMRPAVSGSSQPTGSSWISMKELAALLDDMVARGVVTDYAVFGAVAQMRYTEAVATQDAEVLVALPEPDAWDLLSRIHAFCEERGYRPEGEAVRIGDWPAQFIPAFSDRTKAARPRLPGVQPEYYRLRRRARAPGGPTPPIRSMITNSTSGVDATVRA